MFRKPAINIYSHDVARLVRFYPELGGQSVEIVLWTDDTDRDYRRLANEGTPSLSPPHDFSTDFRAAWVADPDGNPIRLVQRRTSATGD